ncbi:MAG: serine/threonine protein kinase [Blastocatellia bacterium]|nr:serine/threonine protein kinase [Blastocatellia bacterium]
MKQCPKCKQEYADSAMFCGNDGQQLISVEEVEEPVPAAPENIDPMIGTLIDNKYKVERYIGGGGMGSVYAARHSVINKQVAIKIFTPDPEQDPSLPERFQHEAEASARIRHPNIVPVNDFGQTSDGTLYMVMEYVEGFPLRQLLDKEEKLSPERAVAFGSQICAAIAVAHSANIIHRDLKPENILIEMIDGRETARVFDFGIAKLKDKQGLTKVGTVLGTPDYMSPEQCSSKEVDARSDIYSLGIILYELLSGQVPFIAPKYQQVLVKHVIEPPRPLDELRPDIPESLVYAVMRALEKEPDLRHQTATELADDLLASLKSSPGNQAATS